jgi:hypothetical protein
MATDGTATTKGIATAPASKVPLRQSPDTGTATKGKLKKYEKEIAPTLSLSCLLLCHCHVEGKRGTISREVIGDHR